MNIEPRARDRDHATAFAGNVFINVWHIDCTYEAVVGLARDLDELASRSTGPVGMLGVSLPSASILPKRGSNEVFAEAFREHGHRLACLGSALLGDGFVASAKRATMAMLCLLARQPCPVRLFASIDDTASWVVEHLKGVDAPTLSAVTHEFVANYQAWLAIQQAPAAT